MQQKMLFKNHAFRAAFMAHGSVLFKLVGVPSHSHLLPQAA
jgi:hypothetical protein